MLEHAPNGWRWLVGLGALPGILQLSALHLLPESRMFPQSLNEPLLHVARVLVLRGQPELARRVLVRMYPLATSSQLERKVNEIQVDNTLGDVSLKQKLSKLLYTGSNRRALGELPLDSWYQG